MTRDQKALQFWLFACAGLVFAMVLVGAVTRLTDSGLSITEWKPFSGAIPPLNEQEWQRVFGLYKESPEFTKQNFWMTLADFKIIFFWEWFHRFLGRIIGLAFAVPLLIFWIRKKIPQGYHLKFLGLLLLGGLQGVMGWVMVQSGLIDRPDVSHYRLAAHLVLALLIFAALVWQGLNLNPLKRRSHSALYTHGWLALGAYMLTVFWGAYTAGLDAGLIYNESFPKMGNQWLPPGLWSYQPWWINFFENPIGVQFIHRWLAMLTVVSILSFWLHALHKRHSFPVLHALALMILLQMGLGIATLFSSVALPLAVLHQAGAVTVLLLLITSLHQLRPNS